VPTISPFAAVQTVQNGSPAFSAGLRPGDTITRFAHIQTRAQFPDIASVVRANQDRQIEMEVLRQGVAVNVTLVPARWEGEGLLGYVAMQNA
jgi:26S proteasome non-ATPase regulatory subunit 9